jgi:hypothetical protein
MLINEEKEPPMIYIPPTGLGDTIANLTNAIGIKPCTGCKARQEALNKLFPYTRENIEF